MIAERPRSRALRLLRQTVTAPRAAGQPLAPERELAEQCGVSRTTVRWALARLAEEGALQPVAGGRTRLVAASPTRPPGGTIANNAVYLLSSIHGPAASGSEGRGAFIHYGALHGLRACGRSVLIPGQGIPDQATIDAILAERPVGVLMPEPVLSGNTDLRLALAAEAFAAAGIPTVVFGDAPTSCDRVISDHEAGGHAVSTWLLGRGCRRQLCLWGEARSKNFPQQRYAGHVRALSEAGCPVLPIEWMRWQDGDEAFATMTLTVAGHLAPYLLGAEPIDAIVALTDWQLPIVGAALLRCGRDIPVVGYDNVWRELTCPVPPAATVDKHNVAIGQAMAQLLEERIAGRLPPAPQLRRIEPHLVVT